MIDLDKNDSQESQVSYRAKNSKEIKELKRSNERLASENRRLKSELSLVVHTSEKKIEENNLKGFKFVAALTLILLFSFMVFVAEAGKNLLEYKRAGESMMTLYNECIDSKNSGVINNSSSLSEISSSILQTEQVELQADISEKAKLNKISGVLFFGFESPTGSVDLKDATADELNRLVTSVNNEDLKGHIARYSIVDIVKIIGDRRVEDVQNGIYFVLSNAKKTTLEIFHNKDNEN